MSESILADISPISWQEERKETVMSDSETNRKKTEHETMMSNVRMTEEVSEEIGRGRRRGSIQVAASWSG